MEISKLNSSNTAFTGGISFRLYKRIANEFFDKSVVDVAKKVNSILPKNAQIVGGRYDSYNKSAIFMIDRTDVPTGNVIPVFSKGEDLRDSLFNISENSLRQAGNTFETLA